MHIIEMEQLYKYKYNIMHFHKKKKMQAVEDLKKGIDPIEFAKSSNQIIAQYLTPAISTNVHISDQLKTSISAMVRK